MGLSESQKTAAVRSPAAAELPSLPADCRPVSTLLFLSVGPASVVAAETLRQEGFKGHVILACRENVLPYDRIKLSKVSLSLSLSHDVRDVLGAGIELER